MRSICSSRISFAAVISCHVTVKQDLLPSSLSFSQASTSRGILSPSTAVLPLRKRLVILGVSSQCKVSLHLRLPPYVGFTLARLVGYLSNRHSNSDVSIYVTATTTDKSEEID
ncbi:hypothetical protein Pmani_014204 [Petrolisthes manimaculis]|uniref:Uncharacterized protein n=1 Tax=Petrolisthes manimaculis TaxID=1843537 RepID=A0AAE1PUE3_9EUCA|nr:hypothetical protein Pmani_014204 [Petrolisthes manimaculis]